MDYMSYMRAIRSSDLTSVQKLTALMIASHFDFSKGDPAFPSNKLLAKETGLGISTIVRAKKVLSERAYLYSEMQWDNSCKYTPMLPESEGYAISEKLNTHINTQLNTHRNTHRNQKDSNESFASINIDLNQEELILLDTNEGILEKNERAASAAAAGSSHSQPGESSGDTGRDDNYDAGQSEANKKLAAAWASDWLD